MCYWGSSLHILRVSMGVRATHNQIRILFGMVQVQIQSLKFTDNDFSSFSLFKTNYRVLMGVRATHIQIRTLFSVVQVQIQRLNFTLQLSQLFFRQCAASIHCNVC